MSYSKYLILSLAQANNVIDKELEYDLAWEEAGELLEEFEASEYDDPNCGEYEAMSNFLKNKAKEIARIKAEAERKKLTGYRNVKVTAIRSYTKQTEFTIEVPKNLSLDELEDYLANDKKTLLKIEDGLADASLFSNDGYNEYYDDFKEVQGTF